MNFFDPLMTSMSNEVSRRDFIRRAGGCSALTSTSILSTLLNLRMTNKVMAATPTNDYKAMICLFMFGGNDSYQMLAPLGAPGDDTEYNQYVSKRGGLIPQATGGTSGGLAWPKNDPNNPQFNFLPITASTGPNAGRTFGIIPSMPNLQSLYNNGKAAFVANTGTLIRPTTRADFDAKIDLPKGLFSHSDEQRNWQTSIPQSRGAVQGWAGRIADVLTDPMSTSKVAMSIALEKLNIIQTGETVIPYIVDDANGAKMLDSYFSNVTNGTISQSSIYNRVRNKSIAGLFPADDGSLTAKYGDLLQRTHAKAHRDAIETAREYNNATGGVSLKPNPTNPFPNTNIGRQAQQVARAIAAREQLGHNRQIFFISRGNFDDHNALVDFNGNTPAGSSQHFRLGEVDAAIAALQEEIEYQELDDCVVTFSASDFSRTLASNGSGSDHAWGGNHFVVGGPSTINSTVWGNYPTNLQAATHSVYGSLDTDRGRLIPTTSVDEYAAELALWFGINDGADLELVLPNIRNFHTSGGMPIGFLN